MSYPENLASFRDNFNNRRKVRLNERASILRQDLINDATDIFRTLQAADANQRATQLRGILRLWVTGDEKVAPMIDDRFTLTKSFLVENADRTQRLRFHIPVSPEFDDDDPLVIMQFPTPSEVYAERSIITDGTPKIMSRFVIEAAQSYIYRTVVDTQGDQEVGEDPWQALTREFDPRIDEIVALNVDLVNWIGIQQLEFTVEKPDGTIDL